MSFPLSCSRCDSFIGEVGLDGNTELDCNHCSITVTFEDGEVENIEEHPEIIDYECPRCNSNLGEYREDTTHDKICLECGANLRLSDGEVKKKN